MTQTSIPWANSYPSHWSITRIKYLARPERGGFTDGDWIETPFITPDGVRLIQCGNVGTGEYIEQGFKYISEESMKSLNCTEVAPNDVLICRMRSSPRIRAGRACVVPNLGCRMVTAVDNCILKPKPNVDPRFVVYQLSAPFFLDYVEGIARGGTRDRISRRMLGDFFVLLPSLDEQQAIAAFLDRETAKIDELISKKQRLIERVQTKQATIIKRAVTKGLNPATPLKDSGVEWLGPIPEHWRLRRVKYLTRILRGKFTHRPRHDPAMYGGPYPFIQTGEISQTSRYVGEYHQTLSEAGFQQSKQFPKGTLVMTITGAGTANVAILNYEACFPDSIVGFVPSRDVTIEFLYNLFIAMRQPLLQTSVTNTQPNLNIDRIGALVTVMPPISEQLAIVRLIDDVAAKSDVLIAKVALAIERLRKYRSALISAAVTGQIDVRNHRAEVSA